MKINKKILLSASLVSATLLIVPTVITCANISKENVSNRGGALNL